MIDLLIHILVFCVVIWLVQSVIPIRPMWLKTCIVAVLGILFLIWLLSLIGLAHINLHLH